MVALHRLYDYEAAKRKAARDGLRQKQHTIDQEATRYRALGLHTVGGERSRRYKKESVSHFPTSGAEQDSTLLYRGSVDLADDTVIH